MNRREVVMVSAAMLGAATASQAATRTPALAVRRRFQATTALANLAPADIQSAIINSAYSTRRNTLVASGRYPFLAAFSDDLYVDALVYQLTSQLSAQVPAYDIYQLESLVSSTSGLLDRCLSNRRDMYDLGERAIQHAMDYDLFQQQNQPQREIELSSSTLKQRTDELAGQQKAAKAFGGATDDLSFGFVELAKTSVISLTDAVAGEQVRQKNVNTKWDALVAYQAALQDRHVTPGCPLNYSERYGRIEQIFAQDIQIAYLKLRCIQAGMKQVFGLDTTLPSPQPAGYLDKMVTYLRDVAEQAALSTQYEVEFDHIFSLGQAVSQNSAGSASAGPLVAAANWSAAMGNDGTGLIQFQLANEFPTPISNLRIRAIGAAVIFNNGSGDSINNIYHPRSVAAVITPPQTPDPFSAGSFKNRPPVVVGAATWFDPTQLRMSSPPGVVNVDPRKGTWQMQLSPNLLNPQGTMQGRGTSIQEVKLYLRLGAIVDSSVFPWPSLDW